MSAAAPPEETMRAGGRGKWSDPGVPHKGWTCVDIVDLGAPIETCEMCETMQIRYVHYMRHPEYPTDLGCGCICAGHMEEDYVAAREREHRVRLAGDKRDRWTRSPRWWLSQAGNPCCDREQYLVVVFAKTGGWGFQVINRLKDIKTTARKLYPTVVAAKRASFDAILWCSEHHR